MYASYNGVIATYGTIDKGADHQRFDMPQGEDICEATTSSTALQNSPMRSSTLLTMPLAVANSWRPAYTGIAAMKDVLSAFNPENIPSPGQAQTVIGENLRRRVASSTRWPYPVLAGAWPRLVSDSARCPCRSGRSGQRLRSPKGFAPKGLFSALIAVSQKIIGDTASIVRTYALYVLDKMGENVSSKQRHTEPRWFGR